MSRSRPFEHIIGHQRVLGLLEREVEAPANAYLFVGATGIGKATVARGFAAVLLCSEQGVHPEACSSCRRVAAGTHPDVILVEPEGRQSLGVDQARATVQQAVMTPVESARKVFLFEDAGSMTEQAANALLKTLEEPTPTTVFVLVTESEDDLPSTVASRCRTIHFGRVDTTEVVEALTAAGVDPDRAQSLARVSGGRPGLALALLGSPEVADFRRQWLSIPTRVSERPGDSFLLAKELLDATEPLIDAPTDDSDTKTARERAERDTRRARAALMATGLEILASWYTDAASIQFGGPIRNSDVPMATFLAVAPATAIRNAELVLDAVTDLQANLRPQLLLANLFTRLATVD